MVEKSTDLICLGRAAVDLYGQQIGADLQDETSFAKYLGGSAANTAYGCSILGMKTAMLTRVGDEQMGQFVKQTLANVGVDVSHVITDKERLTGLVLLAIKNADVFPLIFYRNDCADMAISVDDFDESFIASSKALLVNGTHCSTQNTYQTTRRALNYAREHQVKTIFDIDYRPVLWGLTSLGDGETRFISNDSVTKHLQSLLGYFDLIVGTEEEIHIAGGETDTIKALKSIRKCSDATLVVKRGALGASVFVSSIPDTLDDGITCKALNVKVLNVLGAGDAFMSGFLYGWLAGQSIETCLCYANACGSLVVSRHGCSPAMPTKEELDHYLLHSDQIERPDLDDALNYLHRVTTRFPKTIDPLFVLSIDQRQFFQEMNKSIYSNDKRISQLKSLLIKSLDSVSQYKQCQDHLGLFLDDTFGQDSLNEITGNDLWIGRPVETTGSRPLEFEYGHNISAGLVNWPKQHTVKCLLYYHPDDQINLRLTQERSLMALYQACYLSGHELLIEVTVPSYVKTDEMTLARTLARFYNLKIYPDWWVLAEQTDKSWQALTSVINSRAPHCRGVLLQGQHLDCETLKTYIDKRVSQNILKGFVVGDSVLTEPCQQWFDNKIDDNQLVERVADTFIKLVNVWYSDNLIRSVDE